MSRSPPSNVELAGDSKMNASTTSLVSSSSSSSSSGSSSGKPDENPSSSSLKSFPLRSRIHKPRIHINWPRKPGSFVKLPKDGNQLDVRPLRFHLDADTNINADVDVDVATARIEPPASSRSLERQERRVRAREAKVGKREGDVCVREKKVWEGFKEVAKKKVHVAVLEARVRELEGAIGGGKRWGRIGDGSSAALEGGGRGTRQWWVKGWWSFRE